jgi:YD repeat-containing protein
MAVLTARIAFGNGVVPTTYAYDANNQLARVTHPDGRQVSYSYDDMGNLLSVATKTVVAPAVLVTDPIAGAGGAFSGTLQLGAEKYGFKGQFDGQTGAAGILTIVREAPPGNLTLDLEVSLHGTERGMLTGILGDGVNSDFIYLYREVWGKAKAADLYAGEKSAAYNVAFKLPGANWNNNTYYAAGFETDLELAGGAYTAPGKGERVLGLGSGGAHGAVEMALFRGGLAAQLETQLTLSVGNKVTLFNPNDRAYKLAFKPASGLFSGEFTVDAPTRKPKFFGLIVPDNTWDFMDGMGFFLLPGAAAGDPTLSGNAWIGQPVVP